MRLKRAYLTRTLQIGAYTMRSLDGGAGLSGAWTLNLHTDFHCISIRLGDDVLYIPLVHVESFELLPVLDEIECLEKAEVEVEAESDYAEPPRRGPGRPRTKRVPAEL